MKENTLLILAIVSGITGVLLLFGITFFIKPTAQNPLLWEEGDYVIVKGEVLKASSKNSTTFITLRQATDIPVVLFNPISLKKGQTIEVIGDVARYKDKRELVATEVRVIK